MKDLNKGYKRKINELEKTNEELKRLKQYKSVKRYLELEEKIRNINSDLKDLYKKILLEKYANCNHIVVMSDYDYDSCEGRSYRYYGCIKCGLDEAVAKRGYGLNKEENTMLELMNEYKVYKIGGKHTDIACELEDAKELYNEIIENDKDLSDDEIISIFKARAKAKKLTLRR
jgi:hypothetical protein